MPALEALIDSPPKIQQYIIHQFAKILPNDVKARRDFVTNGSLQKIQLIQAQPGTKLKDSVSIISPKKRDNLCRFLPSTMYIQKKLYSITAQDFLNNCCLKLTKEASHNSSDIEINVCN
jgi:hypothetical protein